MTRPSKIARLPTRPLGSPRRRSGRAVGSIRVPEEDSWCCDLSKKKCPDIINELHHQMKKGMTKEINEDMKRQTYNGLAQRKRATLKRTNMG